MIYIVNKKRKLERIQKEFPNAVILDITSSSSDDRYKQLSPFYPHGNIPVPFSDGLYGESVEGIWQGLKVFDNNDIDLETITNITMKNIKRTTRKYGKPLGHRKGVNGTDLLNYFEARMQIYLPTYKWVLENVKDVKEMVCQIKKMSIIQDVVLLDYNTNIEFRNISVPLSHAGLIKLYIEGNYPNVNEEIMPLTNDEVKILKMKEKQLKKARLIKKNNIKDIESPSQLQLNF